MLRKPSHPHDLYIVTVNDRGDYYCYERTATWWGGVRYKQLNDKPFRFYKDAWRYVIEYDCGD